MASAATIPPVVLFGYDSSPFTQKVRLVLRLRQIPYTFVLVPSMMPRPVLLENFNLTYRKIPVLAIGKELYIDTSLIVEALAAHPSFPASEKHPALHPDERNRTLSRILSVHYTDRPLFRYATGLIPQSVWDTSFGVDRANLIGHKLNAAKLGAKIPSNLSGMDSFLSILEPLFSSTPQKWFLDTPTPTLADISLFYQLDWASKISRGEGIGNLTGGDAEECLGEGMDSIFNPGRYPGILSWYDRIKKFFADLPLLEKRIERHQAAELESLIEELNASSREGKVPLIRTAPDRNESLDTRIKLTLGSRVSIAPADTGRGSPTVGKLVGLSTEEVVIVPDRVEGAKEARVRDVRIHFPRVEFVVGMVREGARL